MAKFTALSIAELLLASATVIPHTAQAALNDLGHNGAWRLQSGGESCAMVAGDNNGELTISESKRGTMVYIYGNPQAANDYQGVVTDRGTGETLMIKPMKMVRGSDGVGYIGQLNTADMIRLWTSTALDMGQHRIVNVRLGTMNFDIDIQGAMGAYQNVQSCAGSSSR